jgi:hypothetical protein
LLLKKQRGLLTSLLDANPFVAKKIIFFVRQVCQKFLSLGFAAINIDALVSVLVYDVVVNQSHIFIPLIIKLKTDLRSKHRK